jgi:hypothetical protein
VEIGSRKKSRFQNEILIYPPTKRAGSPRGIFLLDISRGPVGKAGTVPIRVPRGNPRCEEAALEGAVLQAGRLGVPLVGVRCEQWVPLGRCSSPPPRVSPAGPQPSVDALGGPWCVSRLSGHRRGSQGPKTRPDPVSRQSQPSPSPSSGRAEISRAIVTGYCLPANAARSLAGMPPISAACLVA